jgi:hypothetical protein
MGPQFFRHGHFQRQGGFRVVSTHFLGKTLMVYCKY